MFNSADQTAVPDLAPFPITGEWAFALDVLEHHARCAEGWQGVIARVAPTAATIKCCTASPGNAGATSQLPVVMASPPLQPRVISPGLQPRALSPDRIART